MLTGPHVEHCQQEVTLLAEAGGHRRIESGEQFFREALTLLRDPRASWRSGLRALEVARQMAAAPGRVAGRLLPLIAGGGAR